MHHDHQTAPKSQCNHKPALERYRPPATAHTMRAITPPALCPSLSLTDVLEAATLLAEPLLPAVHLHAGHAEHGRRSTARHGGVSGAVITEWGRNGPWVCWTCSWRAEVQGGWVCGAHLQCSWQMRYRR